MWRIVLTVIMGMLMLGWILFCAVQFFRHCRRLVVQSDVIGRVKCEKCGTVYTVESEEFTKSFVTKTVSTTKTKREGVTLVNSPRYHYYAKKFYCPHCGKKRYAQVLNIDEIAGKMRTPSFKAGIRYMILMFAGAFVIMGAVNIVMFFFNLYQKKQVEEMRQQYYEERMKDW